MDADSVLSLTDSPNVQAVNGNNTFNTHKCLSNRLVGNLHGSSFHQHGNAVSECFARSVKHNYGENVCADGVKVPQFVARHPNDKGSDNNADWVQNIAQNVQVSRLNVQTTFPLTGLLLGFQFILSEFSAWMFVVVIMVMVMRSVYRFECLDIGDLQLADGKFTNSGRRTGWKFISWALKVLLKLSSRFKTIILCLSKNGFCISMVMIMVMVVVVVVVVSVVMTSFFAMVMIAAAAWAMSVFV